MARRFVVGALLVSFLALPECSGLSLAPRAPITSMKTIRLRSAAPRVVVLRGGEVQLSGSESGSTSTSRSSQLLSRARAVGGFLDRRFFIVGIAAVVGLAFLAPGLGRTGGPLRPELTVKVGATASIFLLSGLSLPTSELAAAAMKVRAHALIQGFSLGLMPVFTVLFCRLLGAANLLSAPLREGMILTSALPTTVNMCVALTRSSGGSTALAIFNAVLGNLLGVLVTPWVLLQLVGRVGAVSLKATFAKLGSTVLLPLLLGQLLRRPLSATLSARPGLKKTLSRTSESLLLLIVFTTFCDLALAGFVLPASALLKLLLAVGSAHLVALAAAWQLAGAAKLPPSDRVAFLFCAPQKSLALGLPLLKLVFSDRADLALLCTPLLLQHPLQLLVGSLFTTRLQRYVADEKAGEATP